MTVHDGHLGRPIVGPPSLPVILEVSLPLFRVPPDAVGPSRREA